MANRSVSRKLWWPTILSPETSSTWIDHGAQPPSGSGLYEPERDVAVGLGGHQAGAPTARCPGRGRTCPSRRAPEPEVVGRHRHDDVVVEQGDQRRDVVALEGVDVAGRAAPPARRRPASCSIRRGRATASVARARCRALLTDATVVSSSSATSVACQRRTSRRMSTARCRAGRCWRAVTNARRIDSLASATSAGSPSSGTTRASGIGVDPGVLGPGRAVERVGHARRAEVHGQGPALAAPQHVEAHVGGDAVQPRPHRRAALEASSGLPRPHHRLLHGVLGLEARAEHPVAVADELSAVRLEDPRAGFASRQREWRARFPSLRRRSSNGSSSVESRRGARAGSRTPATAGTHRCPAHAPRPRPIPATASVRPTTRRPDSTERHDYHPSSVSIRSRARRSACSGRRCCRIRPGCGRWHPRQRGLPHLLPEHRPGAQARLPDAHERLPQRVHPREHQPDRPAGARRPDGSGRAQGASDRRDRRRLVPRATTGADRRSRRDGAPLGRQVRRARRACRPTPPARGRPVPLARRAYPATRSWRAETSCSRRSRPRTSSSTARAGRLRSPRDGASSAVSRRST